MYIPYVVAIWKRKIAPHPFGNIIWGLISLTEALLALINHSGLSGAGVLLISGLICMLQAGVVLVHEKMKHIDKADWFIFTVAVLSIVAWIILKQPLLALTLILFADLSGLIPSLRKIQNAPFCDSAWLWLIKGGTNALAFLAITHYSLLTTLPSIFWTICNTLGGCYILYKQKRAIKL